MSESNELLATIDRKEGRSCVLIFPDNQELVIPAHLLSRDAHEGDVVHLRFFNDKQAKADKATLARNLLEEILNGK
jgi:hypothetical protein